MSRKIIGVTVGTPMNPKRIGEQLENGKSAYELAVENGFKGTEAEWLESLHGEDGKQGKDGVSVTHMWSGTTLYVTSASGTTYANLKGAKGDPGSTPVKGVDYFTAADKAAIVADVISALPKYNGEVVAV